MATPPTAGSTEGVLDIFDGPVAFLFPGQGAQAVGMGLDIYKGSPAAKKVFDEADKALAISLTEIMFEGPAEELERTVNSQPAILTMSLACLAAASEAAGQALETKATFMAGHSLGEYTALAASGALEINDAVWLVRERGRLMQEACDESAGAMAAVLGMEFTDLEQICHETNTQIANINAPGQIVVSGPQEGIAKAVQLATDQGARRVIPLRVSGAFHSHLMSPALSGMIQAIDSITLHNPRNPIIGNCSGKPLTAGWELKDELAQQLCGCVRWQESIEYMANSGVGTFVEFGPGSVLSGMVKRITSDARVTAVGDMDSIQALLNPPSEG